jgi:molybdenum cofactor cytidylyltransferase
VIAGLLLAAGRSSRFGADKLLALLGGRPVVRWSAEALAAGVDELFVVVPPNAEERAGSARPRGLAAALDGVRAQPVENGARDAGLASSIAAGIAALPADCDAVVLALADQPLVSRRVVGLLRDAWRASGARAVAPRYRDGRGHPVLFSRACFEALGALRGDSGARAMLDAMGDALLLVPVDQPSPRDVDTVEALEALRAALAAGRTG